MSKLFLILGFELDLKLPARQLPKQISRLKHPASFDQKTLLIVNNLNWL